MKIFIWEWFYFLFPKNFNLIDSIFTAEIAKLYTLFVFVFWVSFPFHETMFSLHSYVSNLHHPDYYFPEICAFDRLHYALQTVTNLQLTNVCLCIHKANYKIFSRPCQLSDLHIVSCLSRKKRPQYMSQHDEYQFVGDRKSLMAMSLLFLCCGWWLKSHCLTT